MVFAGLIIRFAMSNTEFWSKDCRYGLRIPSRQMKRVIKLCIKSGSYETGGVLAGYYTDELDCAVITNISEAPKDSKSGRTWFNRGVHGMQNWLNRLWYKDRYYLGEWHFHPYSIPVPSSTDIQQMKSISASPLYHCPEPVLLIIGGNPSGQWTARCYTFPGVNSFIELEKSG